VTTFERNISFNNAYTNETETEQELENDPLDILDIQNTNTINNKKAQSIDNITMNCTRKEDS
jgi:hypothetical protein